MARSPSTRTATASTSSPQSNPLQPHPRPPVLLSRPRHFTLARPTGLAFFVGGGGHGIGQTECSLMRSRFTPAPVTAARVASPSSGRRYRPKGGPSGGNGGRGGDVILEADHDLNNLIAQYYQPRLLAANGQFGLGKGMDGHAGDDLVVKVPCGTLVWRLGPGENSRRGRLDSGRSGPGARIAGVCRRSSSVARHRQCADSGNRPFSGTRPGASRTGSQSQRGIGG